MALDLEEARHMLGERLLAFLESLQPALRGDVKMALSAEGKLLHQPSAPLDGRWALLPFCLALDLNPGIDPIHAAVVAVAVECLICATDVLDDGMDGDRTPLIEELGMARALNVALVLLSLSQDMLLSLLEQGVSPTKFVELQTAMQHAILAAAAGQQQDLLAEDRLVGNLTREECLKIAAAKAGALLSLACRLGAICAGVTKAKVEQWGEMGKLLGIAAQLDNDAHDLYHLLLPLGHLAMTERQKSDLTRAKKTLPVVLAAHSLQTKSTLDEGSIDSAFRRIAALTGEKREICVCALREGILATWGISLLYRERARDFLRKLKGSESLSLTLRQILGFTEAPEEVEER